MSCLAPCPACGRHVATDETACPFCAAALPDSFRLACSSRKPPSVRLSRAARLAVGAALIGVQASCASSAYGIGVPYDSGVVDSPVDGNDDGAASAPLEQAPPRNDNGTHSSKPKGN